MLNILNITSTQHQLLTELISGTPNDDFLLNTSKTLFRLHRVLLDFYKYILSCAIKFVTYLFGFRFEITRAAELVSQKV